MADNEVVIKVRSEDDTGKGFASAKDGAKKAGVDIASTLGKSGAEGGAKLASGVVGSVSKVPGLLGPIGGLIGAALAPMAGGVLAAGIIGAAGAGGVIGGLTLAAKHPAVNGAFEDLSKQVSKELKAASTDFVPAAMDAIGKLKSGWQQLLPDVRAIFQDSAKFVAPLVDGVVRAGKGLASGLREAIGNAGPVMQVLGDGIGRIGESIGTFFATVSENSEGASLALDDFISAVTGTIEATGELISFLAGAYEEMHTFGQTVNDTIDGWFGVTRAVEEVEGPMIMARNVTRDATIAIEGQIGALRDLAAELKAQTDPLFGVLNAQQKVTKAQGDYNDAIREHGRRSPEAREALLRLSSAAIDLNGKLGTAAGGFNGKLTPAMRTALQNAGMTAGQIARLEKELKDAAAAAKRWEGTFTQTYVTNRIIKGPGGQNLSAGNGGRQGAMASGGIRGSADGAMASSLTWVGEQGPELIDLPAGSRVHSNPDSARMAAGMGGGSGPSGPVNIYLTVDGQAIAMATLPSLQDLNRTQYGGDVTAMFPASR